jgi:hypothetical protein
MKKKILVTLAAGKTGFALSTPAMGTLAETRQENFDNIRTLDLTKIVSLLKSL